MTSVFAACHSGSSTSSVDKPQNLNKDTTYIDTGSGDDELSPEIKESLDYIYKEKMRIDVSDTSNIP